MYVLALVGHKELIRRQQENGPASIPAYLTFAILLPETVCCLLQEQGIGELYLVYYGVINQLRIEV